MEILWWEGGDLLSSIIGSVGGGRDRLRENAKKIVSMVSSTAQIHICIVYVICNETRQNTDSEAIGSGTAV
jgi:hypothetical protein